MNQEIAAHLREMEALLKAILSNENTDYDAYDNATLAYYELKGLKDALQKETQSIWAIFRRIYLLRTEWTQGV